MKDIVEIYKECGDFHESVKRSGLTPLVAHIKLMKSGVLKIQDKIKYASKGDRLGGLAEELFQKLVPDAVDANKYWQKNNPIYDFMYKGLTIDVKYSSYHSRGKKTNYWNIRTKGKQNITVAFLERKSGDELKNPYCLLIPNGFVGTKCDTHVSKSGEWFQNFRIELDELQKYLDEYAEFV